MRVLVTGANGFLGRHVVAALLRRGHSVRAMVRPAAKVQELGSPPAVEVVRADLRAGDLAAAFDGIDVLVHLAAALSGGEDAQFAASVVGTERLLQAMARTSTHRLVVASSCSVYDWSRIQGTLDESSPLEEGADLYARDGYAIAKSWQERVTRREAERHGWQLTVLRPGWIWGRDQGYLFGLGQRFGRVHLVFGPATRLPLTHVENCADLFAHCVDSPRAVGQTFNVMDTDDVRIWRYLGDHLRRTGQPGLRIPVPYAVAFAGVRAGWAMARVVLGSKRKLPGLLVPWKFEARFKPLRFPNRKARDELGWAPPLDYPACLERTYGAEDTGGAANASAVPATGLQAASILSTARGTASAAAPSSSAAVQ